MINRLNSEPKWFLWWSKCICALWSGEPCVNSVSIGHSEARRPQGPCLYRCTVFGGIFRSRGPLFGPAAQNLCRPLCQQGQWAGFSGLAFVHSLFSSLLTYFSCSWPPSGSSRAECGPGSGHRGIVHLPDGLHCVLSGGSATKGKSRTRKPGHWISTLCWSANRGKRSFLVLFCFPFLLVFIFNLKSPLIWFWLVKLYLQKPPESKQEWWA